ncbi:MAG: KamA family radical SAM protein [Deltaproteobacteria bacterium]|nr:KamA family radical SAM protein [Deltaproteobacteria bacterium]
MSRALLKQIYRQPWEEILEQSVTNARELSLVLDVNEAEVQEVASHYPMRINPYYLNLIRQKGDPFYSQAVPCIQEISDRRGYEDPLGEESLSPVPGLTHKYPDRVLFLVSCRCAMYCRFCNRKRKVGRASMVTRVSIREGISYIRKTPRVRDVLLSGGDPLLLSDRKLFEILSELKSIPHVEIIRIGTRVPCTLPQRITPELVNMLRGFHPLYINTHFNHPDEITAEASLACERLSDAGIPVGCQTVLLKGVNDDTDVMVSLMRKLLSIRVRPYYLFQADLVRGTSHFWTPVKRGLQIITYLRTNFSGLCVPHYAIDLPGGGGKVVL